VNFSYHDFASSWLASGLAHEMHNLLGIGPNQLGLIDAYVEAKKIYAWIAEDNLQGIRAEPEPCAVCC